MICEAEFLVTCDCLGIQNGLPQTMIEIRVGRISLTQFVIRVVGIASFGFCRPWLDASTSSAVRVHCNKN